MAARTKAQIVAQARSIASQIGLAVEANTDNNAGVIADGPMTPERAMIALQLLQIELLANIRENETAP